MLDEDFALNVYNYSAEIKGELTTKKGVRLTGREICNQNFISKTLKDEAT